MKRTSMKIGLVALTTLALSAEVALAQTYYRRHPGVETPQAYDGGGDAGIIARAAERAQTEPGVTSELAPDARQTATGGPVGGVPGYDGM